MVRKELPELTVRSIAQLARQVAAASHQEVNERKPLLAAALPSGERIQVVLPPAAIDGGGFSIRKQVVQNLSLDDYAERGAFQRAYASRRRTIVLRSISGCASSWPPRTGKASCPRPRPVERTFS